LKEPLAVKEHEPLTSVEISERKRAGKVLLIILFLLALIVSILFWKFVPDAPVDYASITDHFKYGSIGSEPANGIPYWIWKVLPDMFPDKLPVPGKGYEGFGLIQEPGHDMPIGFSVRRVYIDRVGMNCGLCHTGTVRDSPQSQPRIILGMPANKFDLQRYARFLYAAAADDRFTADNVLLAIQQRKRLNLIDRLIYREAVPRVREALIEQARRLSFMNSRPDWGPGRVDTFNPYKVLQFNFPMDLDHTIGTVDLPVIWNQRPREGMQLHWDGNNTSVVERNKSAALGAGVTPVTIDIARMKRIEDWLWDLPAPKYPYAINEQLATQGAALYQQHCASCHAFGGAQVGKVDPIDQIGTDRARLDSYTYELLENQNTLYSGYPWRFSHFRKTDGYANMPLDGVWLRAPFLHNGSVPTLRDLLETPDKRPANFYRGYDVFDQIKLGFVSDVSEENGRKFFKYDTSLPGNSNAGHLYGTNLSPAEKDALVEYMKKL
jgi:RoxA-like, cytochrome c-like/Cytochrome C oxidase, cbb3-type, subunit III